MSLWPPSRRAGLRPERPATTPALDVPSAAAGHAAAGSRPARYVADGRSERHRQQHWAWPRRRLCSSAVSRPSTRSGPVPQVQRVGEVSEPGQRARRGGAGSAVRRVGDPATRSAAAPSTGSSARQPGNAEPGPYATAASAHGGKTAAAQRSPQRPRPECRQPRLLHRNERSHGQLPCPGRVKRRRRVDRRGRRAEHRPGQGPDDDAGQQPGQWLARRWSGGAASTGHGDDESGQQKRPEEVELLLDRQRPVVLDRRGARGAVPRSSRYRSREQRSSAANSADQTASRADARPPGQGQQQETAYATDGEPGPAVAAGRIRRDAASVELADAHRSAAAEPR